MSNGEPAPVHQTYAPLQPGITMLSVDQATKWISQGTLSADESAIFVLGDLQPPPNDRHTKLVVPAINSAGADVLLAGWLVQMGAKHILPLETTGERLQTLDVQVCSITLWKDEFSAEDWSEALSSPVRFAKKVLEKDMLQDAISQPWGRNFRCDGTPCPPEQATSIQFHCQIKVRDLRKFLRRSGWTGIHATPKSSTGKPSEQWRPIWLNQPKDILEAKTATMASVAGFIRGQKSTGIRVEVGGFEDCWRRLKPDTPVPIQLQQGRVWKLHPFPYGVDRQVLAEWTQMIKWNAEPVKSLGARAWLFNASSAPPDGVLPFNEHPLIATLVKSRSKEDTVGLVAGPRNKPPTTSTVSTITPFRQGGPFFDPWKQAASATASVASGSTAGPTTDQLDNHDRRLVQLEQTMQQLQKEQTEANKQADARMQVMEGQVQSLHETTQQAFNTLRTDFQTTLNTALQTQDVKVQSTFDEIKQLLLRKDKRKSDSRSDDDSM